MPTQVGSPLRFASIAAFVALFGCNAGLNQDGQAVDPQGAESAARTRSGRATDHIPQMSACTANAPPPRALRRLTQRELNNTLVDLFKDAAVPRATDVFGSDPVDYGFHNLAAQLTVSNNGASQIATLADAVGAYAAQQTQRVATCSTNDAPCHNQIITTFGQRAFRRPLSGEEVADYTSLLAAVQPADFPAAVQTLVSAFVQSPFFLYRSELGTPQGGTFALTAYEIASEISYLTVGSMPDDMLMAAAQSGALLQPTEQQAQVTRLMADARAHDTLTAAYLDWLGVTDLPKQSHAEGQDQLMPAVQASMVGETRALLDELAFTAKGGFQALLTADHTYLDGTLASFYGGAGGGGSTMAQAALPPGRAPGLLGHGSLLASASGPTLSSPTLRGRMVRMRFLCQSVPSPPPGIPAINNQPDTVTTRKRYEGHATNASCATCHKLLDPIGFASQNYDTIGRFRNGMEKGQPVDTTGAVNGLANGKDQPVANWAELGQVLATSDQAQACMARHLTMATLGQLSWQQDACTFDAAAQVAAAAGYGLQETYLAVTRLPAFSQRVMDP